MSRLWQNPQYYP